MLSLVGMVRISKQRKKKEPDAETSGQELKDLINSSIQEVNMDINITIRFEGLDNLANALSDIAGCAAVHLAEMTGKKTLPEKKVAPVMEGAPVSAKKEREIRDVLKTAVPSDTKAEPAKKEEPKPDDMIPREELAGIRQKVAAFIKADPENGKVRVKKWLTEHDAAGISKVLVKDRAALLAFLGGEQVA